MKVTFLKLGFRSLFRQKRRSLITLVVIMFGVGCLLLAVGHSRYIEWGLREMTIHTETGHLQIFNKSFFDQEEKATLEYGLDDYLKLRDILLHLMEVDLVLARIDLTGLITNGDKSVAFIGQGVEPRLEQKLRLIFSENESVYDSLILNESHGDIVVLGKGLAKSLDAQNGDYMTIMTTTTDGALNALDVQLVGTFEGFSPEYEKRAIILPLHTAQILLNTQKVKNLVVTIDETEKTSRLRRQISELLRKNGYSVVVKEWQALATYYHKVKRFYYQMIAFLSIVLFSIVFFSTSNTIVMSIIERTQEIGTLLSLGTSRWQILETFFFEGLFIGIIGGLASALFALSVSFLINHANIMLPPPPGMTIGYPLQIRTEFGFYMQVFLATVMTATFSSILPAFRVTRMKIVDALGHI